MIRYKNSGNGLYFKGSGNYYILIITSGRTLRWPYSKFSDPPKYNTIEEAQETIKKYVKFCNACVDTKYKRVEAEFEVVSVKDYGIKN